MSTTTPTAKKVVTATWWIPRSKVSCRYRNYCRPGTGVMAPPVWPRLQQRSAELRLCRAGCCVWGSSSVANPLPYEDAVDERRLGGEEDQSQGRVGGELGGLPGSLLPDMTRQPVHRRHAPRRSGAVRGRRTIRAAPLVEPPEPDFCRIGGRCRLDSRPILDELLCGRRSEALQASSLNLGAVNPDR